MINDTNEQPNEKIHRVRPGSILNAGASIPMDLGYTTFPEWTCIHQPGSSPKLLFWGFLWRLQHIGMLDY